MVGVYTKWAASNVTVSSMSASIRDYLQKLSKSKRKASSTSSSGGEESPERQSAKSSANKPTPKKPCKDSNLHQSIVEEEEEREEGELCEEEEGIITLSSEDSEMAPPAASAATMDDIMKKLDSLATKEDVKQLRESLSAKLLILEQKVAGLQMERTSMKEEIEGVKNENKKLKEKMQGLERKLEKDSNEHEQYSRRWNLRVFGLKEGPGEDCSEKCLNLFNGHVKVDTRMEDIQVAHRVGPTEEQRAESQSATDQPRPRRPGPRPIIVQFASRRVRDQILKKRKILAKSGVSIAEDLTVKNFKLLKRAQEHSATMNAWPANGRIIAQLKNSKKLKIDIDTDLDTFFALHMSS